MLTNRMVHVIGKEFSDHMRYIGGKHMSYKIAMSDTIWPNFDIEKSVLEAIGGELHLAENSTPESILAVAKDADAMVVVYAEITADIINQLEKCKVIVRTGIGVNNVDCDAATKKGIYVAYVPDYCWDEVSDHAFALAFSLARKVTLLDKNVKGGAWDIAPAKPMFRLRGQTFGLVGLGNIAKVAAQKAKAFGFNVIAMDPFVSQEDADPLGVKMVEFDQLIAESDIISIHCPLVDATHHLFNEKAFDKMKNTAFLVNTSRGPVIDTKALVVALKSGKIAGAGLDVLEDAPPDPNDELLTLDNVIITPHSAFYSDESSDDLRQFSFEEVVRVIQGEKPKNLFNKEVLNS